MSGLLRPLLRTIRTLQNVDLHGVPWFDGQIADDFMLKLLPTQTFTKYAGNPILSPSAGQIDAYACAWGSVIKEGTTYYMFYRAQDAAYPDGHSRITYATSADLYSWTKSFTTLVDVGTSGAPDSQGCEDPHIIKWNGTYYLTYIGYDGTYSRTCLATATSITGPYTKEGIILNVGGMYDSNVARIYNPVFHNGVWKVFYEGGQSGIAGRTILAYSSNLKNWVKKKVLLEKGSLPTYNAEDMSNGPMYIVGDAICALIGAKAGGKWRVLGAISPDGGDSLLLCDTPVLDVGGSGADDDTICFPTAVIFDYANSRLLLYYSMNDTKMGIAYLEV